MLIKYKDRYSIRYRVLITLITSIFLFNDIALGVEMFDNSHTDTLSPTSSFRPIVTIEEKDGGLSIVENQEEKEKLTGDLREDAGFVYINILIGQFLKDSIRVSQLGMTERGIAARLEDLKKAIGSDLPHIDFGRFRYMEMYLDQMTVCLPYTRKDDGRTQLLRYYLRTDNGPVEFPNQVLIPAGDGVSVVLEDPLADEAVTGEAPKDIVAQAMKLLNLMNIALYGFDFEFNRILSELRSSGSVLDGPAEERIRAAIQAECDAADAIIYSKPGPASDGFGPSPEEIQRRDEGIIFILVGRHNEIIGCDHSGDIWIPCLDKAHSALFQANFHTGQIEQRLECGEKANPALAEAAARELLKNLMDKPVPPNATKAKPILTPPDKASSLTPEKPNIQQTKTTIRSIDRGPYTEVRIIARADRSSSLGEGINACLSAAKRLTGLRGRVVKHSLFVSAETDLAVSAADRLAGERAASIFGEDAPAISIIAQPPFGAAVEYECTVILPKGEEARIEYRQVNGTRYAVILENGIKWVYAAGISGTASPEDIPAQSASAFETMEAILNAEGLSFSDVLRQWNYIPRIVDLSPDGKRQHYQMFNDVRAVYYSHASFESGYPAATGIGTSAGPVTLEFIAVGCRGRQDVVIKGITNLLQTDPHAYAPDKLVGEALEERKKPETPKFERGKVILIRRPDGWDARIYVSGTASIRGPDTISIGDAAGQTKVTYENIEYLISEGNVMDMANLGSLGLDVTVSATLHDMIDARTYVKNREDEPAVSTACSGSFTYHHLVWADVCRPNLLMETEGEAVARVSPRKPVLQDPAPSAARASPYIDRQRDMLAVKYLVYNSPHGEASVFTLRAEPGSAVSLRLFSESGNGQYAERSFPMTQVTSGGLYAVCVPRWASAETGGGTIMNPGHRYTFTFEVSTPHNRKYRTAGKYYKASAIDPNISDPDTASITIPNLIERDHDNPLPPSVKEFEIGNAPDTMQPFLRYLFSRDRVIADVDRHNDEVGEELVRQEMASSKAAGEALIAGGLDDWLKRRAKARSKRSLPAAVVAREKIIGAKFRDKVIDIAMKAKAKNETVILGLDTTWIPQGSGMGELLAEMDRLIENLRRRGLDNIFFERGKGDDVASKIILRQKEQKTKFSNIIVIGSQEILNSDQFSSLKGSSPEDAALLIGVDPKNLKYTSGIRLPEMYLLAMALNEGKTIPELDQTFILIVKTPDGRPRMFVFIPIKPLDLEKFKDIYELHRREIDLKA